MVISNHIRARYFSVSCNFICSFIMFSRITFVWNICLQYSLFVIIFSFIYNYIDVYSILYAAANYSYFDRI